MGEDRDKKYKSQLKDYWFFRSFRIQFFYKLGNNFIKFMNYFIRNVDC